MDTRAIQSQLAEFAHARDWDQFHSPKNLSMALAGEAGELLEIFQWLTEAQSSSLTGAQREAAAEEIADILIYALRLADRLGIDIAQAVSDKIAKNALKYPVERSRGSAAKRSLATDRRDHSDPSGPSDDSGPAARGRG